MGVVRLAEAQRCKSHDSCFSGDPSPDAPVVKRTGTSSEALAGPRRQVVVLCSVSLCAIAAVCLVIQRGDDHVYRLARALGAPAAVLTPASQQPRVLVAHVETRLCGQRARRQHPRRKAFLTYLGDKAMAINLYYARHHGYEFRVQKPHRCW